MTRLASNVTSIRTVYVAGVPTANQRAPLREPCSSASETGAVPSCTVRAIFSGSHIYLTRSCMTCTYMQHSRNLVMVRRQDATTTTGGVPTPTASSPSFFSSDQGERVWVASLAQPFGSACVGSLPTPPNVSCAPSLLHHPTHTRSSAGAPACVSSSKLRHLSWLVAVPSLPSFSAQGPHASPLSPHPSSSHTG